MAWQHISSEVRVTGFGKCCISSAMDGSDDEWNDSEEVGNERSVRDEDSGGEGGHIESSEGGNMTNKDRWNLTCFVY
jgi:hypothetical protein